MRSPNEGMKRPLLTSGECVYLFQHTLQRPLSLAQCLHWVQSTQLRHFSA